MIEQFVKSLKWYAVSRSYPSERMAREGWELVDQKLKNRGLSLGVYRHGSTDAPGTILTVISLQPEGVEKAERLLSLGEEITLEPEILEALILRRMRVVIEQEGEGYLQIRRGLAAGAHLNPDGTMDEPVGRG